MTTSGASKSSREVDLGQFEFPLPIRRPCRLRTDPVMRVMTAEMALTPKDLILPMFAVGGIDKSKLVSSLPEVAQHTEDSLVEAVREAVEVGISTVDLFGVPPDVNKDGEDSESWNPEDILNHALHRLHDEFGNNILIMVDTYLDEFTDHGHCDILDTDRFGNMVTENDHMLINYVEMAVAQADTGAYVVSPSGMMDGQIATIRKGLNAVGHEGVSIVVYSTKYASVLCSPFREAVGGSPRGDRRICQQNPADRRESLLEVQLDVNEGTDMVTARPTMSYLDILREIANISPVPVAIYQVSDEYAMIHAATASGWIDLDIAMMEAVLNIRHAGTEQILIHAAVDLAKKLRAQF